MATLTFCGKFGAPSAYAMKVQLLAPGSFTVDPGQPGVYLQEQKVHRAFVHMLDPGIFGRLARLYARVTPLPRVGRHPPSRLQLSLATLVGQLASRRCLACCS